MHYRRNSEARKPEITPLYDQTADDLNVSAQHIVGVGTSWRDGRSQPVEKPYYRVELHANTEYDRWSQWLLLDEMSPEDISRLTTLINMLIAARAAIVAHQYGDVSPLPHIKLLESLGYKVIPPE